MVKDWSYDYGLVEVAGARMTAGEFTRVYAEQHGYTLEQLDDMGIVAIPCDCGEEGCQGWQMTQQRVPPS